MKCVHGGGCAFGSWQAFRLALQLHEESFRQLAADPTDPWVDSSLISILPVLPALKASIPVFSFFSELDWDAQVHVSLRGTLGNFFQESFELKWHFIVSVDVCERDLVRGSVPNNQC